MSSNPTGNAARKALEYARRIVREGFTQIVSNSYPYNKHASLFSAIHDVRALSNQKLNPLFQFDEMVTAFESMVQTAKKYSLGNCTEMACMALDYILCHEPNLDAEVFHIIDGDHVFLVIGRAPKSDPEDPETWGEKAYICDPWSNVSYPATEYKTKLHDYYFEKENGRVVNHTKPIDLREVTLAPYFKFNTRHIRQFETNKHIDKMTHSFNEKLSELKEALRDYHKKLIKLRAHLLEKYGEQHEKYQIIDSYLKEKAFDKILEFKPTIFPVGSPKTYRATGSRLNRILKNVMGHIAELVEFSIPDTLALYEYQNQDSYRTKFLRLFSIPPLSIREIDEAAEALNQQVSIILGG